MSTRIIIAFFTLSFAGFILLNYFSQEILPINKLEMDKIKNEILQDESLNNNVLEFDDEALNEIVNKRIAEKIEGMKKDNSLILLVNQNFYIGIIIALLTITSFLTSIYLSIEKLFFRKFYEEPNYFKGIRRSFFISIIIVIFFLKTLISLSNETFFIILVLFIVIDKTIVEIVKQRVLVDKNEEQSES